MYKDIFIYDFIACNDIDRWPTPYPGKILSLPIMGTVMKVSASVTFSLISDD